MKKLFFAFAVALIAMNSFSQTCIIHDEGSYIRFEYSNNEEISIRKDAVNRIDVEGNQIVLKVSEDQILHRSPISYFTGYATPEALKDYLDAVCFRKYDIVYSYNGSSLLDSVFYKYSGTTEYIEVYTYSGTDPVSKTILTQ